ncbi:MAG: hypothetical protein ABSA22_06305, partial [Acidimicrobiales bacterium]
RVYSAASGERPGCELEFVRVGHDPSAHVDRAAAKSDRARMDRVARSLARRGANLNHGESARRPLLVVNPKAP